MTTDIEKQAEGRWGATDAYKECREKSKGLPQSDGGKCAGSRP